MDYISRSNKCNNIQYDSLMMLSRSKFENNPDSAIYLAKRAKKYIPDDSYRGYINETIGIAYLLKKDYNKGFKYLSEAYMIYNQVHFMRGLIGLYMDLGKFYNLNMNQEKSLKYYLKAKDISIKYKENDNLQTIYKELGNIYFNLKQYDESIQIYMTLIKLSPITNSEETTLLCYYQIGKNYFYSGQTNKADSILTKASKLAKTENNIYYKSNINCLKGEIEFSQNNMDKALVFYKNSFSKYDTPEDRIFVLGNIASVYAAIGNEDSINTITKRVINASNNLFYIGCFYESVAKGYLVAKDYDKTKSYIKKAYAIYNDFNDNQFLINLYDLWISAELDNGKKLDLIQKRQKIIDNVNAKRINMIHVQNEYEIKFLTYVDKLKAKIDEGQTKLTILSIVFVLVFVFITIFIFMFIKLQKQHRLLTIQHNQFVESDKLIKNELVAELRRIYLKYLAIESTIEIANLDIDNTSIKNNFQQLFDKVKNLLSKLSEHNDNNKKNS